MGKDKISALEALNSIAKLDTTWRAKAEYRKANKESLKQATKILLQKLKKQNAKNENSILRKVKK